jgi:dephospho-CoA kinase
MQSKPPPLVGVTGGIGSGKSSVCRILAELGRTVISADDLARELTENDPDIRAKIQKAFGAAIYDSRGLRRRELAAIVFSDPARRKALDKIVHPRVFQELLRLVSRLSPGAARPYVVVEAALIFESGMDEMMETTILVRASEENRRSRIIARDGLTDGEIALRFKSQNPVEKNSAKAGYVIENDGPEGALLEKVRFVDRIISMTVSLPD